MNYRKTMSKEQKRKTLENKRAKYEARDQSKKEELKKTGWKRNLKFMTLICTLKNFKNKLKLAHFTYCMLCLQPNII
jgi:hypothetical protein